MWRRQGLAGCCTNIAVECDDGNACPLDGCDAALGCFHDPIECPKGAVCDPQNGKCIHLCPADLSGDGVVEAFDLALLLGSWGPCE